MADRIIGAKEEKLNFTYDRIKTAANDVANHTLVAHVWEFVNRGTNRKKEIDSVLGVMSGDPKSTYKDMDGFFSRNQSGSPEGLVGLATSAISQGSHQRLFDETEARSGLLLIDSPPVAVFPCDSYSKYLEYHKSGERVVDPEMRFTVNLNKKEPLGSLINELIDIQGIDRNAGFLYVNPRDTEQIKKARQAYPVMMKAIESGEIESTACNEVNVNAKLEHIAGIVVFEPTDKPLDMSEPDWKKRLLPDPDVREPARMELLTSLHHAVEELDHMQKWMKQHGKTFESEPTILIHQPQANRQDRLVHFPPTLENRKMLDDLLGIQKGKGLGQAI